MQEVTDVDLLKEGDFVAVKLENYRRAPGMKAGYGHSNYQKVASYVPDLRWMIVKTKSFYQE